MRYINIIKYILYHFSDFCYGMNMYFNNIFIQITYQIKYQVQNPQSHGFLSPDRQNKYLFRIDSYKHMYLHVQVRYIIYRQIVASCQLKLSRLQLSGTSNKDLSFLSIAQQIFRKATRNNLVLLQYIHQTDYQSCVLFKRIPKSLISYCPFMDNAYDLENTYLSSSWSWENTCMYLLLNRGNYTPTSSFPLHPIILDSRWSNGWVCGHNVRF